MHFHSHHLANRTEAYMWHQLDYSDIASLTGYFSSFISKPRRVFTRENRAEYYQKLALFLQKDIVDDIYSRVAVPQLGISHVILHGPSCVENASNTEMSPRLGWMEIVRNQIISLNTKC